MVLFTGVWVWRTPPLSRHPPGRQPPGKTPPRQTPPWADIPPWADTPTADTPRQTLLGRHTPLVQTPPRDDYCSGRYASYWNAFLSCYDTIIMLLRYDNGLSFFDIGLICEKPFHLIISFQLFEKSNTLFRNMIESLRDVNSCLQPKPITSKILSFDFIFQIDLLQIIKNTHNIDDHLGIKIFC